MRREHVLDQRVKRRRVTVRILCLGSLVQSDACSARIQRMMRPRWHVTGRALCDLCFKAVVVPRPGQAQDRENGLPGLLPTNAWTALAANCWPDPCGGRGQDGACRSRLY